MHLEWIAVHNFRNLGGKADLSSGLTVFAGENGAGKTNWLEAISVLSLARSFRTAKLQEAVLFEERAASVSGVVRQSAAVSHELRVTIEDGSKTLIINGKKEPARRYLGELAAIIFHSAELEIIRGQPEGRRSFLDDAIVSLHPPFIQVTADYTRVLRQKNALLQSLADEGRGIDAARAALEVWNTQLASLAARIHRSRVRVVERLNEVLETRLFGNEEISLEYLSSLDGKADLANYEAGILERLELRVQAELAAGRSLIGPHRDDLVIELDGRDLRKYGSAGQQRAALLLLLLANIAVFKATRGEYPLFLIDDIDAELDYKRIGQLLEFLEGKTQTIVTTSKEELVTRAGPKARVFQVARGLAKSA